MAQAWKEAKAAARLHEDALGNPVRITADEKGQKAGEQHGNAKTGAENTLPFSFVGSYVLGKRSLDRAAAKRKADPVDGMNHVVDAESFGTDRAG